MGIAVAEKTRFTCLLGNGKFVSVMATTLGRADKKTGFDGVLIIQGTAGDINARRVDCMDFGSPLYRAREELKEGTVCAITVTGIVRITGATYCGKKKISGEKFLTFTKNGFSFWLCSGTNAYLKI